MIGRCNMLSPLVNTFKKERRFAKNIQGSGAFSLKTLENLDRMPCSISYTSEDKADLGRCNFD